MGTMEGKVLLPIRHNKYETAELAFRFSLPSPIFYILIVQKDCLPGSNILISNSKHAEHIWYIRTNSTINKHSSFLELLAFL